MAPVDVLHHIGALFREACLVIYYFCCFLTRDNKEKFKPICATDSSRRCCIHGNNKDERPPPFAGHGDDPQAEKGVSLINLLKSWKNTIVSIPKSTCFYIRDSFFRVKNKLLPPKEKKIPIKLLAETKFENGTTAAAAAPLPKPFTTPAPTQVPSVSPDLRHRKYPAAFGEGTVQETSRTVHYSPPPKFTTHASFPPTENGDISRNVVKSVQENHHPSKIKVEVKSVTPPSSRVEPPKPRPQGPSADWLHSPEMVELENTVQSYLDNLNDSRHAEKGGSGSGVTQLTRAWPPPSNATGAEVVKETFPMRSDYSYSEEGTVESNYMQPQKYSNYYQETRHGQGHLNGTTRTVDSDGYFRRVTPRFSPEISTRFSKPAPHISSHSQSPPFSDSVWKPKSARDLGQNENSPLITTTLSSSMARKVTTSYERKIIPQNSTNFYSDF